jgi:hypothetical protein
MVSEQLKAAYEAAIEKLSLKDQDMLAKYILERIEEMEWDEKWDELLASPESVADMEKMKAKIKASREAGTSIPYIPGKSLEELFLPRI